MNNVKIILSFICWMAFFVYFTEAKKLYFNPFKNPYIEYQVENTAGPENKNKISVISSNVWMLRVNLAGLVPMQEPFIEERAKHFANALKGPDVIVLQEAFSPGARRIILQGLKEFGYKYATQILGSGGEVSKYDISNSGPRSDLYARIFPLPVITLSAQDCINDNDCSQGGSGNKVWAARGKIPGTKLPLPAVMDGGVMIISKYKIEDAKQIFYLECSDWDCGAKKGAVYAKINKDGQIYHIFGTHGDTGDAAQEYGYKRLGHVIEEIVGENANVPVLIAGDFNFSGNEDPRSSFLKAVWPELKKYPAHSHPEDPEQGAFTADGEKRQVGICGYDGEGGRCTTDGVLNFKKYKKPYYSYNQPRPMYSRFPWAVRTGRPGFYKYRLYNYETKKEVDRNKAKNVYGAVPVSDLSDHFAAYGYFEF